MKQIAFLGIAILLVSCEYKPQNTSANNKESIDSVATDSAAYYAAIDTAAYSAEMDSAATCDDYTDDPLGLYKMPQDYSDNSQNNSYYEERTETTPNTYSYSYSESYSNNDEYSNYSNYRETSACIDGVVVYEGRGDYYIVETRSGYTVLEVHSGTLYEGDKVRGKLNNYNFEYIINKNRRSEVRVYIEDYMLSGERALRWLGEHRHLKNKDQEIFDESED